MTTWKTRSLALAAAVLMSGCATTNYYGDQSGNYASDNGGYYDQNSAPYDQYSGQNDQYNDPYNDQVDVNVGVSFNTFQRDLAPYGTWTHNARWGDVWRPRGGPGFRPYFNGYWANTREYGWMWISSDPWDVTYHYGRWVYDPFDGWLWVPGYVWGPSWVVWRSGGGSIGWFPMPPDDYYGNGPYRGNYASFYGYRDWYGPSFGNDTFFSLWIFVGEDRFADRNYRNYVVPQRDYGRVIVNTTEVTNYVTVNNYIVNRSINVERIERASNRRIETVEARNVMRRGAVVTPVAAGRQIEQRERRERPIPVNANAARGRQDIRDARQDARDARQDARDARQDVRDERQDVRNARGNVRDDRQDVRDARQDARGARQNGSPQDVRDARGNARDARQDVREDRRDVRDERQDVRDARGNARDARQDVRGARQDVRGARQEVRQERSNNAGGVQPARARPNQAAPVQARGRAVARQEQREEASKQGEDNANAENNGNNNGNNNERAAARRRNANR